jgi:hypothetical protein
MFVLSMGADLFHAKVRTGKTKLTFALFNFANTDKDILSGLLHLV